MQVTKDFSLKEIACPCCGASIYDKYFIEYLQLLRDIMQIPFVIAKGGFFRCRFYNDALSNSSKKSQHLLGKACDITTSHWTGNQKWKLVYEATKLGLSIGIYERHIHIDRRIGKPNLWLGSY